eukprot:19637-Heterococcus_DN1.PRE.3
MSSNGNEKTIHEHHAGDRTGSTQAPEDAANRSDKAGAVGALASECRCSPECTCEEFEATSKCYCQDGCRCGGKGVDAVA